MIDAEKVEQQLETMIESLAPYAEGSQPNNVVVRMQMQVIPALIRWKTSEANLGTDKNSVLNAFVAMVSSQLVGLVGEAVGSNQFGPRHFTVANTLLQAIGEEIGAILSGERQLQEHSVAAEISH